MKSPSRIGYAVKATVPYLVVATAYVLISDGLIRDATLWGVIEAHTVKDLVFVAVSAAVLFLSSRAWIDRTTRAEARASMSDEAVALAERVVNDAPVGIILTDLDGVVRLWNPRAEELLGWSAQEAVGMLRPGVGTESLEKLKRRQELLLEGDTLPGREGVRYRKDGTPIDVLFNNAILRAADGEPTGALVFFDDITERKRVAEELREAERMSNAKSDFLASMSHELRTPLNSIIGFTDIVRSGSPGPVNEEQERQLGMVLNSARHLLELINDVLDLSQIEAGEATIDMQPVGVCSILESVWGTLAPMAEQKELGFSIDCPDKHQTVVTDAGKARQVLLNLAGNAIKFTQEGEVRLALERSNGYVRFQVTDTGPGIPAADIPHLTEDFFRARKPDPSRPKGHGLGLAISARLVEMLGGRLHIESEVGRGSTFSFTLPAGERE